MLYRNRSVAAIRGELDGLIVKSQERIIKNKEAFMSAGHSSLFA